MNAPFVNLNDGKIHNCKPGSWAYKHEQGHLAFDKTKGHLKLYQQYAFLFWMFSTTLVCINVYMLWLAIPLLLYYIGLEVYEEWWANQHAKASIKG